VQQEIYFLRRYRTDGLSNVAQPHTSNFSFSAFPLSFNVGYKNPSHFAQVFRRVVGVTPTKFRRAL